MGHLVNQDSSCEVLEAQNYIWNHVFSYVNSMSLKCATELGIPDIIHKHGQPITLLQLLEALPGIDRAKADGVYRLMRVLVHSGFFTIEKIHGSNETGYLLTTTSRLLVEDHPLSMKPFVLSQFDPILVDPWHFLSRWFKTIDGHKTPFHTANNGVSFWEKKERDPRFSNLFDQGMASDTFVVANVIIKECGHCFDGLDSLVDVGGGTGTLAKAIVDAFPRIQCTVLDLASVIAGLEGTWNLKYVEGDMFEYIPSSDALLLKFIFHDWSDEESVQILKKCKKAITSNGEKRGKLIIIEMVVEDADKSIETQYFLDMLMMTVVGGRERKEKEWAKLFFDAGFTDYKIFSLSGLRSIIEVYP